MSVLETINLGVVGACGRGRFACHAAPQLDGVRLHAVCDLDCENLDALAAQAGAEPYTDYEAMLDSAGLDAVVVATPMPLHVPQSIAALRRGIHVLSEVPAAVSLEQCRDLARAAQQSSALYMLAEFLRAVREGGPSPVDVHAALDMTLPGLISQQSCEQNGAWIDVPDSRDW